MNTTIQDAMSLLLLQLGFNAMAADVQIEQDRARLSKYARVIVKNSPDKVREQLANQFRLAGLL